MNIVKYIQCARELAMVRIDDLEKPLYGQKSDHIKLVEFTSKTLSSCSIHSGNGDRDVDQSIGVTRDGWIKYITEVETATMHTPFKMEVLNTIKMSDEDVEEYLNSKECTVGEVYWFIEKYNKLASEYPNDLKKISSTTETIM
ncbi:hypothetical protein [Priestia megaterium]|uniref:hypothetical protein n=1 Tax=Priestia megaterium TaxID=1404 RepID=UPI002447A336|nr:hypothetical protein [Priestia megaterium]MDH2363775.1 hypothetical protein [Priestia megaterium]